MTDGYSLFSRLGTFDEGVKISDDFNLLGEVESKQQAGLFVAELQGLIEVNVKEAGEIELCECVPQYILTLKGAAADMVIKLRHFPPFGPKDPIDPARVVHGGDIEFFNHDTGEEGTLGLTREGTIEILKLVRRSIIEMQGIERGFELA